MLTQEQLRSFERDGFVLVEGMFTQKEIDILLEHTGTAERVVGRVFDMPDTGGRSSKLSLWNDIGDDVFGAVSASPRIVENARAILRDEVYHWHSKVMMKEPRVGGAWEWHQDYGYWYNDGCLYPRLVSAMLVLDEANRENGCLKVLVGSHHIGRIEHGSRGNQSGADPERISEIVTRLPVHYVEAGPGSVLFFHCNLLHSSEPNLSNRPRRSYICCYNAMSNIPYGGKGHGEPTRIKMAAKDAIIKFAAESKSG